jgi:hypothetical protein
MKKDFLKTLRVLAVQGNDDHTNIISTAMRRRNNKQVDGFFLGNMNDLGLHG